jgi:hypothetical protein
VRSLASFIMRGPWQAALVVAAAALLGLLLPPVVVASGAALALVALRQGLNAALNVLVLAGIGASALAYLGVHSFTPIVVLALLYWLPLLALALILRRTITLATTLHCAALLGAMAVPLFYGLLGDPQQWLAPLVDELLARFRDQGALGAEDSERIRSATAALAPFLPGQLARSLLLLLLLSLFLARWWQALLYHPGGFRREFYELRLGRAAASVMLALLVVTLLSGQGLPLIANLTLVLSVVFIIQGAALVHCIVAKLGLSTFWLVAFYLLLLTVFSQFMLILAVIDAWADFRARVRPATGAT